MAEGDFPYSLDQIEQLLQCSVCLDRYKTPKLLPCQHTFCHQPCLEGLVEHRTRSIKCPECRAQHFVPRGGTASFPNNLTINSFLELMNQAGQRRSTGYQMEEAQATGSSVRKSEGCQYEESQATGSSFTPASVPQAAGAVGGTGNVGTATGGFSSCGECLRQRTVSRCGHCHYLVCESCQRSHLHQLRADVNVMINQIRRGMPNMSEALSNISNTGTQLQQRCETAKEQLTEAIERYIRELRNRHRQLLGEIDNFILGELRALRSNQENVEVEIASMASFCDSSESSLNRSSTPVAYILEVRDQCQEQLQTLRGYDSGRFRVPTVRELQIAMEGQLLSNAINSFGEVIITSGVRRSAAPSSEQPDDDMMPVNLREDRPERRAEGRSTWQSSSGMDYTSRVQDAQSPSATPTVERRGFMPWEIRPYREYLGEGSLLGPISLPSSPNLSPRRRPRREHHSDTRLPGMMGEENGSSFLGSIRRRHRSIGALPTSDEVTPDRTSDDSDSPPRVIRDQTFVTNSSAMNSTAPASEEAARSQRNIRPAVRFEVSLDQPEESLPDDQGPTYQRMNSSASMYVSTPRNKYNEKGASVLCFGGRGNDPGKFTWPRGVAVSRPDDNIFVADSSNNRVQVFDNNGRFIKAFGTYGQSEGEFDCLSGITVNGLNQVIVSDRYNHRIQIFDRQGRFQSAFGAEGTGDGQLNFPWGVACDNMGFIYVCDKENHRIQVFQSNGTFVRKWGRLGQGPGDFENPHYVAISNDNRVYISDSTNNRIQVFSIYGDFLFMFGSDGTQRGQMKFPRGISIDSQGFVVVADSGNNRVQIFRADGRFYSMFGSLGCENGQFRGLEGVALQSPGNLVVSDRENHRIQVF